MPRGDRKKKTKAQKIIERTDAFIEATDGGGWNTETIWGFSHELTRCDHCGHRDPDSAPEPTTVRVSFLEDHQPYWLCPGCVEAFIPPQSEVIEAGPPTNRRKVGTIISYDRRITWQVWRSLGHQTKRENDVVAVSDDDKDMEDAREDAAVAAAERLPYDRQMWNDIKPGGIRDRARQMTITRGSREENPDRLNASRKFWALFNDEQHYWAQFGRAVNLADPLGGHEAAARHYIGHSVKLILMIITPI